MSQLIADLPPAVATPELRMDCPDELKFKVVDSARALLSKKYPVNNVDGVRVDFGGAWGLVRASNTQPVLVMRFEATTERRLLEIRRETEAIVQQALWTNRS